MGFLPFPIIIIQERKANDSVLSDEAGRVFDAREGMVLSVVVAVMVSKMPHTYTQPKSPRSPTGPRRSTRMT